MASNPNSIDKSRLKDSLYMKNKKWSSNLTASLLLLKSVLKD